MRPLHALAGGLLLLALDFRTTSVDLLPDVVGWLLVTWAAHRLTGRVTTALAGLGTVASLSTFALPYHYEQFDPFNERMVEVTPESDLGYAEVLVYDPVTGWRLALMTTAMALVGVVLWRIGRRVEDRAAHHRGELVERSLRWLRWLRWATVGLWVLPRLVAMVLGVEGGYDPVWNDPAGRIALVGTIVAVAYAAVLANDAREPWARPAPEPVDAGGEATG